MNKLNLIASAIILFVIGCVMWVHPTPDQDEFFCLLFVAGGLVLFALIVDTLFSLIMGVVERIKW
jgi:hypothetical protein